MASTFTPTSFNQALGPYKIDVNDFMGDSVGVINANTNYAAAGIAYNTTLINSVCAHATGSTLFDANGYHVLPGGLTMQWGTITPTQRLTTVTLPIPFTNSCLSVIVSIGSDFTDVSYRGARYKDNSLIWGGYPDGLNSITIMSNLRVSNNTVVYKQLYWQAIGW